MEAPYFVLDPKTVTREGTKPPCEDLVLASENAAAGRAYVLSLGDTSEEDILRFLFVPKSGGGGAKSALDRQDYRLVKKQRV
jgi:hypothetical protein